MPYTRIPTEGTRTTGREAICSNWRYIAIALIDPGSAISQTVQSLWVLKKSLQLGSRDRAGPMSARFPDSVFPFVTCEPSLTTAKLPETGRL